MLSTWLQDLESLGRDLVAHSFQAQLTNLQWLSRKSIGSMHGLCLTTAYLGVQIRISGHSWSIPSRHQLPGSYRNGLDLGQLIITWLERSSGSRLPKTCWMALTESCLLPNVVRSKSKETSEFCLPNVIIDSRSNRYRMIMGS